MDVSEIQQKHRRQMLALIEPLLDDPIWSDVTFMCEDGTRIFAHRLIAAAASPYLLPIFLSNSKSERTSTVHLPRTVTKRAVRIVFSFVYTGKVDAVHNDEPLLREVVSLCHFLQIWPLFLYCLHQLAEEVSATDVQQLIALSHQFRDYNAPSILSHLANKLCTLRQRWDFQELEISDLKTMLQYSKGGQIPPDSLMIAMLSWVSQYESREQYLPELMPFCDVSSLSLNCLTSIEDYGVVTRNSSVLNLLSNEKLARTLHPQTSTETTNNEQQKLFCFYTKDEIDFVTFYDIDKNSWCQTPIQLPFGLFANCAVVACSHHIYFVGGYKSKIESSTSVYQYCPMHNSLESTGTLLLPVFSPSAGVLQEVIYVVDGWEWQRRQVGGCRVQRYNPVTGGCKQVASTNKQHSRSALSTYKDLLYIAGLYVPDKSIERYDAKSDQWTVLISFSLACAAATFSSNRLIVSTYPFGKSLNIYDLLLDKWTVHMYPMEIKQLDTLWSAKKEGKPIVLALSNGQTLYSFDTECENWEKAHKPTMYIRNHYQSVIATTPVHHLNNPEPCHNLMQELMDMRKESKLTDITLVCSNEPVQAHQLILATASSYFRSMFGSEFLEARTRRVVLPTISKQVMEFILDFIYAGKIDTELDYRIYVDVLAVAHLMDIHHLFNVCLHKLAQQLSLENFQEFFHLAQLYDVKGLELIVFGFLASHFSNLIESEEFCHLTVDQLKRILLYPPIQKESLTNTVLKVILQWIKFDSSRINKLSELISSVDVQHLSAERYADIISQLHTANNDCITSSLVAELGKQLQPVDYSLLWIPEVHVVCLGRSRWRGRKAQVRQYNLTTNEWSAPKEAPFDPAYGMTAVVFGSHVYFIGGATDQQLKYMTGKIHKYCPFTNTVKDQIHLQAPVSHAAVTVAYDAIFIVGGKNSAGQPRKTVQCFISALGTCKEVASTNYYHDNPSVCFFRESLIVFSIGQTHNGPYERYDFLADQWTEITSLPMPTSHHPLASSYEEKFYMDLDGDNIRVSRIYPAIADWDVAHTMPSKALKMV